MPRLTDTVVKRLPLPAAGNRLHFDDTVPGFAARVTANGHRGFVLNYERGGRQRRYTIGTFGDWTVADARAEARRLRQAIDRGEDPMAAREAARTAPTMAELIARFEAEHMVKKRPSTAVAYKRMLDNHIGPHFGPHLKVADVSFSDIEGLHRKLTKQGRLYQANRVHGVVHKMLALAVRWGWRESNPAQGIERNTEAQRKRYLDRAELTRLTEALKCHSDQRMADIFRILLLTGARKGEVLSMRWADLDLTAGIWSKPAASTKQNQDHVVPLSAPARQLLLNIHDLQGDTRGAYVFASTVGKAGHIIEPKKAWAIICKAANISGLRIHDLRHSFASQLASGGASLPLIGALLGHSNPATTARYAHLFQDPQRAAVERVAAVLTATETPPPIDMPSKK
jgi:integrase